jgi:hypothetical protein
MFTCSGFATALDEATKETMGDVRAAIRSALNKMVSQIKTLVSSEIRKIYNVPAAILNDRLTVFSSRIQNLEAELVIGGRSIPLSYFGMKASVGNTRMSVGVKNTAKGPRGSLKSTIKKSFVASSVSVEVIKGRRTTLAKSAFVAVMRSGHIGVMHRGPGSIKSRSGSKGAKHKQALYENAVVSIATMFNQVGVNDAVVAKIDAELEQLFMHELEFYTERSAR